MVYSYLSRFDLPRDLFIFLQIDLRRDKMSPYLYLYYNKM